MCWPGDVGAVFLLDWRYKLNIERLNLWVAAKIRKIMIRNNEITENIYQMEMLVYFSAMIPIIKAITTLHAGLLLIN